MKYTTQVLIKEYYKIAGKIFADYWLRKNATEEQKKSIDAMDFLDNLMTGNIKKEWNLEDTKEFKQLQELTRVINSLKNETEKQF